MSFSAYNLLQQTTSTPPEAIYGDFDMIICSNVLIYYRPVVQHEILKKLQQALSKDGLLISDESEKGAVERTGLFKRMVPSTALFMNQQRSF